MERRRHPRKPIRLRIEYRTATSYATAYTHCVSKGGCAIVVENSVEPGTRFEFEMFLQGEDNPLEIEGEVVRVQPLEGTNRFEIGIQYMEVRPGRELLEGLLGGIMVDSTYETVRRHPRIPVNLVAHDPHLEIRYLISDLSEGGMRVEARTVPSDVAAGARIDITVLLAQGGFFPISGKVAWIYRGSPRTRTRFGVQFDENLDEASRKVVRLMTRLWRPRHIDFAFPDTQGLDTPTRETPPSPTKKPDEIGVLIAEAAASFLRGFADLDLSEGTAVARGVSMHTAQVRVGLVGDVDGELVMDASILIGKTLATRMLGESANSEDRQVIANALTELTTRMAVNVCEKLDALQVEMDVTAPIVGDLLVTPRDRIVEIGLGGPHGRVFLTVITREFATTGWPVAVQ